VLRLPPLQDEAARALLARAEAPADERWTEEHLRASRGNPFLLSQWASNPGSDGTASLAGRLHARAAEQAAWGPRAVEVVAVAGHPVGVGTLSAVVGVPTDLAGLHRLCATGLLRRVGPGVVEPAHGAVSEAVLGATPPDVQVATHRALAEVLRMDPEVDPAWLARHVAGGGDPAGAVPWALRAADRAEAGLAFDAAAAHLADALTWGADDADRLSDRRAAALLAAGRPVEAGELWASLAPRVPAADARAAEALLLGGSVQRGLETLAPALHRLGGPPLHDGPRAIPRLAALLLLLLLPSGRAAVSPALVDLLWAAGRGLAPVLPMMGMSAMLESLRLARAAGDPGRTARVLGFLAVALEQAPLLGWLGRLLASRSQALDARDPYVAAYAELWEAARQLAQGHWVEGGGRAKHAAELLRRDCTGVSWELVQADGQLTLASSQTGAFPELEARAREGFAAAAARGDRYGECLFRQYLGASALIEDLPERAREQARWIQERWAPGPYTLPHFFADAIELGTLLYEGRADEAARVADAARERARAAGGHRIALWRIEILLIDARVALSTPGVPPARLRALARELAAEPRRDGAAWALVLEAAASGTAPRDAVAAFEAGGERALAAGYAVRVAILDGADPGPARARLGALGVRAPERWELAFTPWPAPS